MPPVAAAAIAASSAVASGAIGSHRRVECRRERSDRRGAVPASADRRDRLGRVLRRRDGGRRRPGGQRAGQPAAREEAEGATVHARRRRADPDDPLLRRKPQDHLRPAPRLRADRVHQVGGLRPRSVEHDPDRGEQVPPHGQPLAGHEVEEIGDIYFNDTVAALDGSGWGTDAKYARTVERETTEIVAITSQVRSDYSYNKLTGPTNTTTITTATARGLAVGENVLIEGAANTSFNGTFRVTSVPTSTTLRVKSTAPDASTTSGSLARKRLVSGSVSLVRVKKTALPEWHEEKAEVLIRQYVPASC
jgi:hypothetical protein